MPIRFNAKEADSLKIFHFALKVDDLIFYCNLSEMKLCIRIILKLEK
jgi:hypothetical protein